MVDKVGQGAGTFPDDLVDMGYVSGVFGVRGWVKVVADTQYADSLLDYEVWWLGRDGDYKPYTVVDSNIQPKNLNAQLEGINDRDVAFALKGCKVAVPRSLMPVPEEGEYYWSDLMGLQVVNLQGESMGTVDHLLSTGANDVLVVRDEKQERLIPFVKSVVTQVELESRTIRVDWGLDY
ncbi:ribosome maturation factor RimM [Burkholderiaceae bacterium DAT-1]|nr:ribosome maturation factor RimM [Burkholderiaceae bacterium DAT-1]